MALLSLCEKAIIIGTVLEYTPGVQIMEVQGKTGLYWARTWSMPDGRQLITSDLNGEMIENAPHDGIMLDIGANIGRYSIPMSTKSKKVFAFEPEPNNFTDLVEQVQFTEDRRTKIFPINKALWNKNEDITLYVRGRRGEHSVKLDPNFTSTAVTIQAITLDSFCFDENMFNVNDLTGIKVDVEGAEIQVIQGAVGVLKETRAPLAIETHTGIDCPFLFALLSNCGYKVMAPHGQFVDHMVENMQYLCKKGE
jgi:FkbM family methyltransferase